MTKDAVGSGVRQAGVRPELRRLPPRRRPAARSARTSPTTTGSTAARLEQIHRPFHDGVPGKGDAAVGQDAEARPARRGGRVRVHAARHDIRGQRRKAPPGRPGIAVSAPSQIGRVLPTLNEDGTRRWIRPKPSHGTLREGRRAVAYGLMLVFFLIPHVRIGGKPRRPARHPAPRSSPSSGRRSCPPTRCC